MIEPIRQSCPSETASKRKRASSLNLSTSYLAAAGLAMLMAAGTLAGQVVTSPDTAPATEPAAVLNDHQLGLLHQLESGAWKERKSAEAELAALPVEDEPIIRAMLAATKSAETRARLEAVLRHLDDARYVGATLITMKMTDAPAKAVYAELFRQAGGALKTVPANLLDDPALPKVTIDVDHQPFWAVVEKLQATTKLAPEPEPDNVGGCHLVRGGATVADPHVISGPFFITIGQGLPHWGNNEYLSVVLRVYPEPKLHSVLAIDATVNQAVDDKGNSLEQGPPMPTMYIGDRMIVAVVRFKPAEKNPGTRLVQLSAMVSPQVIFHSEHLDIGDLTHAAPQTIQIGNVPLKFDGCVKMGETWQVKFSSPPDPYVRLMQTFQRQDAPLRILDAAGHELTQISMGFSGGGTGGNKAFFAFPQQPEPRRLIFDVPTDIRKVDSPVVFKDINIPLGSN
jgi:hypothetical protein